MPCVVYKTELVHYVGSVRIILTYELTRMIYPALVVQIVFLLKYFAVAYIPLTFFYIIVLMFKINIPSSQIQGYVFYSQTLVSPIFCRAIFLYLRRESYYFKFVRFFGVLHNIWNLLFLRCLNFNICFQASPLTLLSLDFVVSLYPLALMTVL